MDFHRETGILSQITHDPFKWWTELLAAAPNSYIHMEKGTMYSATFESRLQPLSLKNMEQ